MYRFFILAFYQWPWSQRFPHLSPYLHNFPMCFVPDWLPFGICIFCLTARKHFLPEVILQTYSPSGVQGHHLRWGQVLPSVDWRQIWDQVKETQVVPFLWELRYCQTHASKILTGRKLSTSADLFSFWLGSSVLSMGNVFILHLQGAVSVCPCSLLLHYDYVRNTFLAFLKISVLWKILQNQWYRWQSLCDRRKEKLHNFFPAISSDKCCWQNSKNFNCS